MTTTQPPAWHLIEQSVIGASHIRSGLPNQDAISFEPASGVGPPLIVALSDGHGSSKSFRSHLGSDFAVKGAVALLQELLDVLAHDPKSLSAVKRTAEERLPKEVVRRWQMAVDAHLEAHPFTEEELARVMRDRGEKACRDVGAHPHLAYGATLLAAVATENFLLFLQLGDGDILLVADTGEVTHALTRDTRLIGNETTSLCMDRAWREVRLHFHACHGELPALILLATDGYANSFVDAKAFLKVGSDLLEILQSEGVSFVTENLGTWLEEASAEGSGDDITLGILYRSDVLVPQAAQSLSEEVAPEVPISPACTQRADEAAPRAEVPEEGLGSGEPEGLAQKIVARIKHDGPRELTKQGRITDILEDDASRRRSRQSREPDAPQSECVSVQCTDVTVQCADVTVQCTDVTVQCTDVTVQCTDVSVQCTDVLNQRDAGSGEER
jgi:serine/threonine protein phosphatase PrpC